MNCDDIIHMAREAGWETPLTWDETDGFFQRLERFAALIAAAEREACAKVVEADGLARGEYGYMLTKAAARIRARGEK